MKTASIALIIVGSFWACYLIYQRFHISQTPVNSHITFNLSSKISDEQSRKITEGLRTEIDRNFNMAIGNINTTITYFAMFLSVILVLAGFVSFGRVNQLAKLVETLDTQPEKVFNAYFRKRLTTNLNELFSKNQIRKSDAIREIQANPQLSAEHFDILSTAINNEIADKNNMHSFQNLSALISIMMRLDEERGIALIYSLADEFYSDQKMFALIPHLLISKTHVQKYRLQLDTYLRQPNVGVSTSIMNSLFSTGFMDDEFAKSIAEKCDQQVVSSFMYACMNQKSEIDMDSLVPILLKRPFNASFYIGLLATNIRNHAFLSFSYVAQLTAQYIKACTVQSEVEQILNFAMSTLRSNIAEFAEFLRASKAQNLPLTTFKRHYKILQLQPEFAEALSHMEIILGKQNLNNLP